MLTCDQEKTQWAWLKKAGVTPDHSYFLHPVTKQPIFIIPDPAAFGDCVTDEKWASEDEDVVGHDHILSTENQVVDLLGGYVVTRLRRQGKLSCMDCQLALLSGTQSILLQEKQYDDCMMLQSSSDNLKKFLMFAESIFRSKIKSKSFIIRDEIGKRLRQTIMATAAPLDCCHQEIAADAVLKLYLTVRLHHHCKTYNQNISAERKKKKEDNKLRKLGSRRNIKA